MFYWGCSITLLIISRYQVKEKYIFYLEKISIYELKNGTFGNGHNSFTKVKHCRIKNS